MDTAIEPMDKVSLKQGGRFYYGWVIVFVGLIMLMLGYVSCISVTSVFVIPVTAELGIDRGQFVLYTTILSLFSVFVAGFFGKRMARGNIKLIMIISAMLTALGFFGFSRATDVWHFYVLALFIGQGFALVTTMPTSILINNWFGGKIKGTAMSLSFIGSGLGGMLMTPLLNYINTAFGWRSGYLTLAGVFLFVIAPVCLFLVVKTPEEKGFYRMGQVAGENSLKDAKGMVVNEALKTPMLWLIVFSIVIFIFGSSAILFNSVPYLIQVGFTPERAAALAGLNLGGLIVGKILTGVVCDKFGTKIGSILSSFIFSGAFIFLFIMPSNPTVFVYGWLICYALGGGGITVCPPLLVNSLFGEKDYGNIIGIMTMATNIGGAFGGTIAAYIYDVTGSYGTFWFIAAIGLALSGIARIIAFRLRRKYSY